MVHAALTRQKTFRGISNASTPPREGEAASFNRSALMASTFSVNFFLPFSRHELYSELLHPSDPLGSTPTQEHTILRNGYTPDVVMSPGCVRKVAFAAPFYGETISELSVADPGDDGQVGVSRIVWRQLSTSTRLRLFGRDNVNLPEFGILLEGDIGGTLLTLTYKCARAPHCCASPPKLASSTLHAPVCALLLMAYFTVHALHPALTVLKRRSWTHHSHRSSIASCRKCFSS